MKNLTGSCFCLRGLDRLDRFSAICFKEDSVCDFEFAVLLK